MKFVRRVKECWSLRSVVGMSRIINENLLKIDINEANGPLYSLGFYNFLIIGVVMVVRVGR